MCETYQTLASELLYVNEGLRQMPAEQQIAKLARGELFVLNYLLTHQYQAHPSDLSRHMVVSTARVAALLNRMEEKKLIARGPDPENRRQIIVRLLPQGTRAIQQIRTEVLDAVAGMLERLGPEDAKEYLRLQKKLLSAPLLLK